MHPEAGSTETSDRLVQIQREILRFGRHFLTWVGLPVFIINIAPAHMAGTGTPALWLQTIILPASVAAAWMTRNRSPHFQALILGIPFLVVSILSLGQWGLSFGAGVLQMAVLSLLLVFFYPSVRALLLLSLLVVFADAAMAGAILNGWIPTPDIHLLDPLDSMAWRRVILSSAAAFPVTAFIIAKVMETLMGAMRESEARLKELQEEQAAREQAQRALDRAQRMEIVGRLASGLSHDFNNNLTVIRGTAEILRDDMEEGGETELAEDIIRAADNAADLSRRLLIFSRQGEASEPGAVDLGGVLQKLGRSLRRLLPADIEINIRADATQPARVDPAQLDQAILNLCLNARDAMPDGGFLDLYAGDAELPDGSPGLLLRVKDSGVGMNEETLAQSTEPFFSTKEEGKGTGLGLAMVKKMVDQHGGTLRVDSSPGLGSSFNLLLPACGEGENWILETVRGRTHRGKVLLVDDDAGVRRVLVRILERDGHRLVTADRPGEAAAIISGGYRFDLLITDGVPDREASPSLVSQFLLECPEGRVLLYTGYSREELLEKDVRLGNRVEMAQKPQASEDLSRKVSELISQGRGGAA